eukprot:7389194-Prymnesium_polylepis.1
MKSETGPEQVRPARVLSPRRSVVRSSLVVQDSTPRQTTARRHRASRWSRRSYSSPGGLRRAPIFARSVEEVSRLFRRRKRSSSTEHASM